jgi:hypothetical protein
MALASDGTVLINVGVSDGSADPKKIIERALAQGGRVFVGVTLHRNELPMVLKRLDDAIAEIVSWTLGGRHRHSPVRGRAKGARRR